MSVTRLVTLADAGSLAELYRANRDFLAQWEPARNDEFYTVEGQRGVLEGALAKHADGSAVPHVILDGSGRPAGRISSVTSCEARCSRAILATGSAQT